jgi:hypothetical protein
MKCPNCGAQAEGAFCSECGAPLKGAKCRDCQSPLATGARFCNNCGAPTGRAARARNENGGDSKLPWIVAGLSLVVLIAVVAWGALRNREGAGADTGRVPLSQMDGSGMDGGGAPGPLTGSPREQADRLFNRVMTERESGDTAQARFFVPMAVQAYQMAGELDADGQYHVSLLHHVAGDYQASLAAAQQILATSPNHLLGLAAAASAARGAGDNAAARRYYQQFLNAYDTESKSTGRQEYVDHGNMLPELKTEAENFIKGQ